MFCNPFDVMQCLVLIGENKVPIRSAMRFIKILFRYKQTDAFTDLAREMQQVLSVSTTPASVKRGCIPLLSVVLFVFL